MASTELLVGVLPANSTPTSSHTQKLNQEFSDNLFERNTPSIPTLPNKDDKMLVFIKMSTGGDN